MDDLFAAPDEHHSLFFALLPDPAAVAGIQATRQALEAGLPPQKGAGVPEARLHLTLHWLGEWSQLPEAVVDGARAAAAAVHAPGFTLRLDHAACFGHGEAIWVLQPGEHSPAAPDALSGLHRALAASLARHRVRLPASPAFAPHVTLRRRATCRLAAQPVPPVVWEVEAFCLLHSRRTPDGTRYTVLGRWPLAPVR